MVLDLPPQLILPPKPAIIRPAEPELLAPSSGKLILGGALPGVGGVAFTGAVKQAALTARSGYASQVDRLQYTWTGATLGTESSTRQVLVAASGFTGNPSAITVGGVSLTKLYQPHSTHNIYIGNVPTGTSADIVVDLAVTVSVCIFSMWTFDNGNPAPSLLNSGGLVAANTATDITIPYGGAAFAWVRRVGSPYTTTWTNMTQNYNSGSQDTGYFNSAHRAAGATGETVSINCSGIYSYIVIQ